MTTWSTLYQYDLSNLGLTCTQHPHNSLSEQQLHSCDEMLHDLRMTYSNLSQLTSWEQCETHCSNPNPNPHPLPNHYLILIVHPQILQQSRMWYHNSITFELTRITSQIALLSGAESVLVPSTASVDEPLASHGGVVVEVAGEIATAITSLCWEAADVHTSSFGAGYHTSAGTCTARVKFIDNYMFSRIWCIVVPIRKMKINVILYWRWQNVCHLQ